MFISRHKSHYQKLEPPFEIPDSWEWVSMKEIFLSMEKRVPCDKNFSYIDIDSIDNKRNIVIPKTIDAKSAPSRASRRADKGDIVFSLVRPYLRNIALVPKNNCIASTGLYVFTPSDAIDSYYAFRLLLSEYVVNGLNSFMKGDNSPAINVKNVEEFVVALPPLSEQKRISNKIETVFQLLTIIEDEKEVAIKNISKAKSKILELAMQGKLVPQDRADEPAAETLKRINPKAKIITDNPHSWNIPETWCWCQLGDLFNHNTGKALNSSNQDGQEYEYITTSNVYWDRFELDSLKKMFYKDSEVDKCKVVKGDLLVCEGGDVGRSAIWNMDFPIMIQNHLHRLRPVSEGILASLYLYLFRLYKEKELIGGKGIALQGFSSNTLHKLVVPCIPKNEQKRIVAKIEELYSVLDKIEASLQS